MGAGLAHFLAASPAAAGKFVPHFPKDMVSATSESRIWSLLLGSCCVDCGVFVTDLICPSCLFPYHSPFDLSTSSYSQVSFVSVGDGSVNNAHFLSAINLAQYAAFRKFKCPIVFTVTDNDLCISLKGYGYLSKQWVKGLQMPLFEAKGDDIVSIYEAHKKAADHARSRGAPAFVLVSDIKRRFGHAATDRQAAYLQVRFAIPSHVLLLLSSHPGYNALGFPHSLICILCCPRPPYSPRKSPPWPRQTRWSPSVCP